MFYLAYQRARTIMSCQGKLLIDPSMIEASYD
ncbi:hypothetical protein L861_09390 [Litchfieldella anticariensis FP35 = DSM 16096]|uniref:Uncharacterized protein n=1 Tax=Litchfieldella anticariensis (strain DSM 16096 / CECT 5854 / CIP 108499 / LMG 22089 / FP35) TaxID=1121939 RepID=S2KK77_LITA3|nr:hypothetical protein L861_09390 [Halomonas anticariensis FP35 = DSM 16096]